MLRNSRSELWKYFDNVEGEHFVVCKQCKQRLRNNRSFNLKQHMRKMHNIEIEKQEKYTEDQIKAVWLATKRKKYIDPEEMETEDQINAVLEVAKRKIHEDRVSTDKRPQSGLHVEKDQTNAVQEVTKQKIHEDRVCPEKRLQTSLHVEEDQTNAVLEAAKPKKHEDRVCPDKRSQSGLYVEMKNKTVIRAVMGLLVEDGVAPHLFDSKNMKCLINPLYEAISDREGREFKVTGDKSERALSMVANHIRDDFSNDLHWRLLSLKVDTDLNASPKSFALTALFVNKGQVEVRVLGLIDLKDEEELSENHINEILHKFNIDAYQIVAACWDNTKQNFNRQVQNSDYLTEIEKFEEYPDIYVGDIKVEPYIGAKAQLCVLDIFKNSNIFQPFLECRNLAKFINDRSNGYYEIFEIKQLRIPQLDSPWKWGSTYAMINDLSQARAVLEHVKYEKLDCPQDQFILNENLWSFIEAYCKVLNIIQKSVLKFYSEELHFGDFYAQWLKCKLLTEKLISDNKNQQNYIAVISAELLKSIEKRSKELLSDDGHKACLYLDPRFQHILNLEQKNAALDYLKSLWSRAKLFNADVVKPVASAMGKLSPDQQFADDEDAFLNEFLSQDVQLKNTTTADVYNIIERLKLPFQMIDTNILLFWREQKFSEPEMYALSTICFAMPATQNYNKIRYSHMFKTKDDSKLSKFTKENLLFTRLNAHLLDGAISKLNLFKDDKSTTSGQDDELSEEGDISGASTSKSGTIASITLPTATTRIPPLTPISSSIVKPLPTAILTPAGPAFLPPNITVKAITSINNQVL